MVSVTCNLHTLWW